MLANISKVGDFALNQKDKSQKQFNMENCVRNWHIFRLNQHNYELVCFFTVHQCLSSMVKSMIYKHRNMMSTWRHW